MERIADASRRPFARITGVVYLFYFLTAVSADVFVGPARLSAYDAVNVIAYAFYITVTLLFYCMFKPVNRNLSLLAACFSLLGCSNDVLGLFDIAPYKISSLVFFGPYCLLLGYLIFRATFLPRILGVLMASAGVGWLIFLSPLANYLSSFLKALGFIAELSLCLIAKVKPGGSFGYTAVLPESAAAQNPAVKIARVLAQPDPSKVREFADDIRDGKFVLPIGRRMPLRDAAEAHVLGEKGGIGKILLLTVDPRG